MQKFDLCLTQKQNLPMPSSLESLPRPFESMWRAHLIMQKAFGSCRSTAQSVAGSSHTFTASDKTAPGGFLSCCCTASSAQLSPTLGDSLALLPWWICSTWAQGWGEAIRDGRETSSPGAKPGLAWSPLLHSLPAP